MTLEDDKADIKRLTREMHEAMQDMHARVVELKALMAECDEIRDKLIIEMAEMLNSSVALVVSEGLEAYQRTLSEALNHAEQTITKRFERQFGELTVLLNDLTQRVKASAAGLT